MKNKPKSKEEIQKRNLGSANQLIVSQKWVDETCKTWDCTEDELRDFFSGKTEFPK